MSRAGLGGIPRIASLVLFPQTRRTLRAIVDDRRRAVKRALLVRLVPPSDERSPVLDVARQAGVGRPTVWCRHHCFAEDGLDGPTRDETRPTPRR